MGFWVLIGIIIFGVLVISLTGETIEVPQQIEKMKDSESEIVSVAGYAAQGLWVLGAISLLVIAILFGG